MPIKKQFSKSVLLEVYIKQDNHQCVSLLKKHKNKLYIFCIKLKYTGNSFCFNPIQDGLFRGCSRIVGGGEGAKSPPPP